jgi:hypothetical protein
MVGRSSALLLSGGVWEQVGDVEVRGELPV